jgi:DNA-binding transcriptional regulator YiaG
MGERKRHPPSEAVVRRWAEEDDDSWGEPDESRIRLVYLSGIDSADVGAMRRAIGMSQAEFAAAFGISVWTLRKWEQGQRRPHGPARALLRVIAREPAAARRALAG